MPQTRIPIHWATEEELRTIRGIGPVRAAAILAAQRKPDSLLGPWVLPALLGVSEKQALELADEFCWDAPPTQKNRAARQIPAVIWWAGITFLSSLGYLLTLGVLITATPSAVRTQWNWDCTVGLTLLLGSLLCAAVGGRIVSAWSRDSLRKLLWLRRAIFATTAFITVLAPLIVVAMGELLAYPTRLTDPTMRISLLESGPMILCLGWSTAPDFYRSLYPADSGFVRWGWRLDAIFGMLMALVAGIIWQSGLIPSPWQPTAPGVAVLFFLAACQAVRTRTSVFLPAAELSDPYALQCQDRQGRQEAEIRKRYSRQDQHRVRQALGLPDRPLRLPVTWLADKPLLRRLLALLGSQIAAQAFHRWMLPYLNSILAWLHKFFD